MKWKKTWEEWKEKYEKKYKRVKIEEKKEKEGGSKQERILWNFQKSSAVFYIHNFYLITAHSVPHASTNVNSKPQCDTYLTNILQRKAPCKIEIAIKTLIKKLIISQ